MTFPSSPALLPSLAGPISVPSTTIGADVETVAVADAVDTVVADIIVVSMAVDLVATVAVVRSASRS
ncbi:unnamed protein product [Taenia asiatica]|uniref:Secreted peptide n=1 Tax=Taenia asiatica TaxID=60517 RepID=A0A0R3W7M5_TAEAS|nr:unnamed protein product [Taenia asiatica]